MEHNEEGHPTPCYTSEGCPVLSLLIPENYEAKEVLVWFRRFGLDGVKMYEENYGETKDIWLWDKLLAADALLNEMQRIKVEVESRKRNG